jgi:hypothetical protein
VPDPNVGDLLLAKIDELVASAANLLEEIRAATEQLHPERAVMPERHHDGVGDGRLKRLRRRLAAWWRAPTPPSPASPGVVAMTGF